MKKIHEKRYPRLTEAEDNFRRFIAELTLPTNMEISHAPSFEKDELKLTVSCSGREGLMDILNRIRG